MPLYVANVTKKVFELHYWVENTHKPIVEKIQPGGQKSIYPQGNQVDHQRIVDQHKVYGLIPVSEIDRSKEFIGQCYQFDKPITHERMFSMFERNDEILYEDAQRRRQEAAAATDDLVKRAAQETDNKVKNFEMEIEEVEQKGVDTQVHEVITVSEDAQEPRRRGRPRRN
jgi:hypothetical protein